MKNGIKEAILLAIKNLQSEGVWGGVELPEFEIVYPPEEKFGDFACSLALSLASKLKKSPLQIAEDIKSRFVCDEVERIDVVAPGHMNFFVKKSYLQNVIREVNERGENFGNLTTGEGKKVLLEFVSANPTGPIHLGNGRSAPSGDTLARVLAKYGFDVSREYYINDFGNQIVILGHSILQDDEAQYKGDYIEALAEKRPQELTDPMAVGEWGAREILEYMIQPTCEKMDIWFDEWFSEKSLHDRGLVEAMLKLLEEKNLVYEQDGAKWFKSTEFGDDKDRVLMRSNGLNTYLLADFVYHGDKVARGFDKLITFLGADHHSEANVMKRFVNEVLGKKDMLEIILTQIVRVVKDGQEVKMSKRRGTYYALDDLIEEVGKDAVRFIFTSYASSSHINFDINTALEHSEKNPVYYVQYAHARLCSILEKAKEQQLAPSIEHLDLLVADKELSLLRELMKFPELIERIAASYETHLLPRYAIDLADKLHSFYNECRVIDNENRELSMARLALVSAVKTILAETLRLIGVSAPSKM